MREKKTGARGSGNMEWDVLEPGAPWLIGLGALGAVGGRDALVERYLREEGLEMETYARGGARVRAPDAERIVHAALAAYVRRVCAAGRGK